MNVAGDLLNEPDETFRVNLSTAVNATIADTQATGTIVDDDAIPTISINDPTLTEGNSGTANMTFTLTLSAASGRTVTVAYATSDGTATQPADYSARTGTVTFTAGQVSRTFTVPVVGDTLDEFDETFLADLATPTNATIAKSHSVGTIVDNDALPTISTANVTVTEGDSGTSVATFTVSLSAASAKPITVDFATADGTATAGADYEATSGTLSWTPGEVTKTVAVTIDADLLDEANETFTMNLTNPTNATVSTASRTGTITDNDPTPSLVIGDVSVAEGGTASVPVTLSAPSGRPVTVDFATADGTALSGQDYTAGSGTITFAPGVTSTPVDVTVSADTAYESDETFLVTLTNPSNATISNTQATVTIANEDPVPSVSIGDAALDEGNAGTATMTFTLSLSNPSAFPISVDVTTADGTAAAPVDYAPVAATVTFAPGDTSATVDVPIVGDVVYEPDETVAVGLANAVGAGLDDAEAVGTIWNDDAAPVLDVADIAVSEGDAGTALASFSVTLTGPSEVAVTVDATTADGAASSPVDFDAVTATLTFAPGVTARTLDVPVHGDTTFEPDEDFTLHLGGASDAVVGDGDGVGTIVNDDASPGIGIDDVTVTEGDDGTVAAAFTVSLATDSSFPVTVDAWTEDGEATADEDFEPLAPDTLVFAPGETVAALEVTVIGDLDVERDEAFVVRLSNAIGATIGDDTGVATILDDDARPPEYRLSLNDPTVGEETDAVFTLHVAAPVPEPLSFEYATHDRSAVEGSDYEGQDGTVVIEPGQTEVTVTVPVVDDAVAEADETFVMLVIGEGESVAATATIRDDDQIPTRIAIRHATANGTTITVDGLLSGAEDRATVRVVVLRRVSAGWSRVDARTVTSRPTGRHTADGALVFTYRAHADVERAGVYRVRVAYRGDSTHLRSLAHLRVVV